jgi:nitroimidazol reductase NimA-like FMN-containing flavoprotein (pyridoxamine 5'-phosphate oxidase superfamily)
MQVDEDGLEVLDHDECLRLLASRSFGRIGLSADALPTIVPVNYAVVDDQIVIRTRRGTQLARATRDAVVAFEVDEFDERTGTGWSVVIRGLARELTDRAQDAPADAALLDRWHEPEGRHVGVSIDLVSGRRLCA